MRREDDELSDHEYPDDDDAQAGGEDDDCDIGDPCPHCGKAIYHDAVICPHCGDAITPGEQPPGITARYGLWVTVLLVLVLAGLVVCAVLSRPAGR